MIKMTSMQLYSRSINKKITHKKMFKAFCLKKKTKSIMLQLSNSIFIVVEIAKFCGHCVSEAPGGKNNKRGERDTS